MTGLGTSITYINERDNTNHYVRFNIKALYHKQVMYKNDVEVHRKTRNSTNVIVKLGNVIEILFHHITVLAYISTLSTCNSSFEDLEADGRII
jgi:hypothetical protein